MRWCFFGLLLCFFTAVELPARTFTAVAYNVENLFDLDGISLFEDYRTDPNKPFAYNRHKLLTKLRSIVRVLRDYNNGDGPELILFQELEGDFTPQSSMGETAQFLERFADTTAEAMLTTEWQSGYAGLPAQAWLLKAMHDAGLQSYNIACPPVEAGQKGIAHVNALFSHFPITSVDYHRITMARAIIEATVEIDRRPLHIYVNHWKSGASNPKREQLRVENAKVLRSLIDHRLEADPQADILIGGDLNSHYNHAALFPDIPITGINHILGSQGNEDAVRQADGPALYNLWHELPVEERYSDVWRGNRGSLMHLIVSRGLYDDAGISYLDNSFDKLARPGLNADSLGRPFRWSFAGRSGGGFSDHFPVHARFCLAPASFAPPSSRGQVSDKELPLRFEKTSGIRLIDGAFLGKVPDEGLDQHLGLFYKVQGHVTSLRPLRIKVNGYEWPAYVPAKELYRSLQLGQKEDWVVTLGVWKGKRQFIVEGIL